MPIFAYLVAVGSALLALIFFANATLEKAGPPIVTTQRVGLPQTQVPAVVPAPRAARAEAPPEHKPVTGPRDFGLSGM